MNTSYKLIFSSLLLCFSCLSHSNDESNINVEEIYNIDELIKEINPQLSAVEDCLLFYSDLHKEINRINKPALLNDLYTTLEASCSSGEPTYLFDNKKWNIPGIEFKNDKIKHFFVNHSGLINITLATPKNYNLHLVPYYVSDTNKRIEWVLVPSSNCIEKNVCYGKTDAQFIKPLVIEQKQRFEQIDQQLNQSFSDLEKDTKVNEYKEQEKWITWRNSQVLDYSPEKMLNIINENKSSFSGFQLMYSMLSNYELTRINTLKVLNSKNDFKKIIYQKDFQYEQMMEQLVDISKSPIPLIFLKTNEFLNNRNYQKYVLTDNELFKLSNIQNSALNDYLYFYLRKYDLLNYIKQFSSVTGEILGYISKKDLTSIRTFNKIEENVTDDQVIQGVKNNTYKNPLLSNVFHNAIILDNKTYLSMIIGLQPDMKNKLLAIPQTYFVIQNCQNDISCLEKFNNIVKEEYKNLKNDFVAETEKDIEKILNKYDSIYENYLKDINKAYNRTDAVDLLIIEISTNIAKYNLLVDIAEQKFGLKSNLVIKYQNRE